MKGKLHPKTVEALVLGNVRSYLAKQRAEYSEEQDAAFGVGEEYREVELPKIRDKGTVELSDE